jgi:hypothetical protein
MSAKANDRLSKFSTSTEVSKWLCKDLSKKAKLLVDRSVPNVSNSVRSEK